MHFMILLRKNKKLLFTISYKNLIYEKYEFHFVNITFKKVSVCENRGFYFLSF